MDGMQRKQADELEEVEKRLDKDIEMLKHQFGSRIEEINQKAETEKLRALVRSSGLFLTKANTYSGFERRRDGNSRTESQTSPGKPHCLTPQSLTSEQISSTEIGPQKNLNSRQISKCTMTAKKRLPSCQEELQIRGLQLPRLQLLELQLPKLQLLELQLLEPQLLGCE